MIISKKIILLLKVWVLSSTFTFAQNNSIITLQKQIIKEAKPERIYALKLSLASAIKQNKPDSAILLSKDALKFFINKKNYYQIGLANLILAQAHIIISQKEIANSYNNKAFQISNDNNFDSIKAISYLLFAEYYKAKSDFEKSIENAHNGLSIFEKLKVQSGIIKAKGIMAQNYQMKGDLGKAEGLLKEIINQPGIDAKSQINGLHTLANIYGMEEKYEEALALDARGLALCKEANILGYRNVFYDNMANCYMYTNRFKLAEEYFYKTLVIDSAMGDDKQMSDTYLNLGQLNLRQNNITEAFKYLNKSLKLSSRTGYKLGTYQAYVLLSDTYKNINADSAYSFLKKAYKVKDSIINESSENKIAELETLYQKDKKEQQLLLQESEINRKNYLVVGLLALLTLLAVSGFYIYKRRQVKNQLAMQSAILKQQEEGSKAILLAEDKERSRISADLHDGVGQLMSAAKMNLSAFEKEINFSSEAQKNAFSNLLSLIDEGCKEVRNVSHQMMPGALQKFGLERALKEMIQQIDSKNLLIDLHIDGFNQNENDPIENIIYRIIQEGINNTIKHAKATELHLSLEKDEEGIRISIEDNGIGFNPAQNETLGIGLENIYSRVQYLKGTIDVDSKKNEGTLIAIFIPAL